jgi:hypothetical protein
MNQEHLDIRWHYSGYTIMMEDRGDAQLTQSRQVDRGPEILMAVG